MQPVVATIATALLILRAVRNKSLTPAGIVAAVLTAVAHAVHPWSVFFTLLGVFFLSGTAVTKVSFGVFMQPPSTQVALHMSPGSCIRCQQLYCYTAAAMVYRR